VYAPAGALRFQFSRSGGPGGQNVNKLNTKAELWVTISALRGLSEDAIARLKELAGHRLTQEGQLHIVAQTSRTQEANRAAALERLRELLVRGMHRPKRRRPTRPTVASRRRRLEGKRKRGQIKMDRSEGGYEQ
jgi:ribosome-associated protein